MDQQELEHLVQLVKDFRDEIGLSFVDYAVENYRFVFNKTFLKNYSTLMPTCGVNPPQSLINSLACKSEIPANLLRVKNTVSMALRKESDVLLLREIARLVVADWGGIRTNPDESLDLFVQFAKLMTVESVDLSADVLENKFETFTTEKTEKTYSCISSWSKLLAFASPEHYFVYDSRISLLLNYLWSCENLPSQCPCSFLKDRSRPKTKTCQNIINLDLKMKREKQKCNSPRHASDYFGSYSTYCKLIDLTYDQKEQASYANLLDQYPDLQPEWGKQLVEMALFAYIDDPRSYPKLAECK